MEQSTDLVIWLRVHVLVIPLGDHLGEEGDAGLELSIALVVGHELEDGDQEVGEDERRHRLAVAAEAKHDGNSLIVTWTRKYKNSPHHLFPQRQKISKIFAKSSDDVSCCG